MIILLAVTSLITPQVLRHTWQASKITLLAIVLFLYRTMKPRVAILGRYKDGTLRDVKMNPILATSQHMVAMRFDGSLYFANIPHSENTALEAVAANKQAKYLLVAGDAINQLDASGEEVVHYLVERLHEVGVEVVFSGFKKQILDVMHATGLFDLIGQKNIFATENKALAAIFERLGWVRKRPVICCARCCRHAGRKRSPRWLSLSARTRAWEQ